MVLSSSSAPRRVAIVLIGTALWACVTRVLVSLSRLDDFTTSSASSFGRTKTATTGGVRGNGNGNGNGGNGNGLHPSGIDGYDDDLGTGSDDKNDFHDRGGDPSTGRAEPSSGRSGPIHYRLVYRRPFRHLYGHYSCGPHPGVVEPLSDRLQGPGMVDFFPEISTSLTIGVVGDSVGMQIAQVMEEAMGSVRKHRVVFEDTSISNLVVSGPIRGGGAFLSTRVNGMLWSDLQTDQDLYQNRRRRRLKIGRGEVLTVSGNDDASNRTTSSLTRQQQRHRHRNLQLRPQPWNRSKIQQALQVPIRSLDRVDVLVQRITFPWTPLDMITMESLEHNTRMAANIFGMETLVYVNFYFCNNVVDPAMHRLFRETIQLVRNFTNNYVPPAKSTLKTVLLLNMDELVDQLNEENARTIGYDVDNEPFETWMMSHYRGPAPPNGTADTRPHHHYHAQLCGAPNVSDHALSCPRNMIFVDGMHFCPSTVGGRVAAGIACLIECAGGVTPLRQCEQRCNDKYMSLTPVPVSEMVPYNRSMDVYG